MSKKLTKQFAGTKRAKRRLVRYSLITANLVLLGGVAVFVTGGATQANQPTSGHSTPALTSSHDTVSGPLDQLSSIDIAVNIAQTTDLAESVAVSNQSDSAKAVTDIAAADTAVASKPQVVSTTSKSITDLQNYTVQAGDTVSSIAAKFNVTSESIRWSNDIKRDTVAVGSKLAIPPVNGIVYTVKAGENADVLAQRFGASKDKIVAFNDAEITGLPIGKQIVIPDGKPPATSARGVVGGTSRVATSFSWGSGAIFGFNGYDRGYCTWYVANRRAEVGKPVPANLGNAYTWDDRARLAGMSVSGTPMKYDVVVTSTSRNPGHVAFVEEVNDDGTIWVSEMNSHGQRSMTDPAPAGGWGRVDYKIISAAGLNFIH